jgi:hypothetical protein
MLLGVGRMRWRAGAVASGLVVAAWLGAVMFATPSGAATACVLAGNWAQTTEEVGSTRWSIEADGTATESGGNASGRATLSNSVLTIDWTTPTDYAGTYRWTLDASCKSTEGKLTFHRTGPPPGDGRTGKSYESTVTGPPPQEVEPPDDGLRVTVASPQRKVELQRNESGWEPAAAGIELRNGDRVHTGFKAGVTLNFPDGTRLHIGPMTLLHIRNISAGPGGAGAVFARLLLKTGEVTAQVNRSTGAAGDFQVKTPTTTASVRGTKFSIAYDGTATTVAVTESSVEVTANNGATAVVTAGNETRSTATAVAPPVPIGQGFKSGGLGSAQALARVTGKLAGGLKRCKFGIVSNRLAPIAGGWSARLVIVGAKQGIAAKPKGSAQFRLKGKRLSSGNALARKIAKGCR